MNDIDITIYVILLLWTVGLVIWTSQVFKNRRLASLAARRRRPLPANLQELQEMVDQAIQEAADALTAAGTSLAALPARLQKAIDQAANDQAAAAQLATDNANAIGPAVASIQTAVASILAVVDKIDPPAPPVVAEGDGTQTSSVAAQPLS